MILENFCCFKISRRNCGEKRANSGKIRIFGGILGKFGDFFCQEMEENIGISPENTDLDGNYVVFLEEIKFFTENFGIAGIFEEFRRNF